MQYTPNYNLKMPDGDDYYSIQDFNANSFTIDTELDILNENIQSTYTDIRNHINDTSNPHEVTKEQLSLGNVENKSSEAIRNEITKENVIRALGYTPLGGGDGEIGYNSEITYTLSFDPSTTYLSIIESYDGTSGTELPFYQKSDTYTRDEINSLVSNVPRFDIKVVDTLPLSDISSTTTYLVRGDGDTNLYTMYIYVDDAWETLGSQEMDLSEYYTSSQIDDLLAQKANTDTATSTSNGLLSSTDKVKIDSLPEFTRLRGILQAGETSISFTDSSITDDAYYMVYTEVYGLVTSNVTIFSNTATLTYDEAQESDVAIELHIKHFANN